MNRLALSALLLAFSTVAQANEANTVRIPLATYEELKQKAADPAQGDDEPVDVDGEASTPRVLEARVTGQITRKALSLELRVTVEGTGRGWHMLPIVPSDAALLDATITGGGTIVLYDDMRTLAFAGPGKRTLVAHLYTSGTEAGAARQVDLNVLPYTSRQIAIDIAGGVDAELTPDALVTTDKSGGRRALKGFIPASEGALSFRWSAAGMREEDPAPVVEKKPPQSKEPPRINVQASMLASVGERLLTVYTTLRYAIFHAPVSRFEWTVPQGVEVIGVQGRGVTDWSCSGDGERLCFVELPFPVQRAYELSIQLEQPLPKDVKTVKMPAPVAKGVQRQSGHVAVEVMGNAEVKPGDGATAIREDVRELPGDLFAGQSTPILLAFKFNEGPVNVVLDIQRRDSVETSPISVDEARYTTVWTTEGRTITEANFFIRNRQRQFLAIQLPKDAIIQSAFVADMPVKPSTGEDGKLRIPLRNGRGSDAERFAVQLVYIRDNLPLPSVGRIDAELPALDSEIGRVDHTLILPDRQHLWAFGGDLSIEPPRIVDDGQVEHGSGMFLLGAAKREGGAWNEDRMAQMQLNAPAAPPAEEAMMNMDKRAIAANALAKPMPQQAARKRDRAGGAGFGGLAAIAGDDLEEQDELTTPTPVGNTGVLPVRIQIPSSGDRYTAHTFYVPPNRALAWHARASSSGARNTLLTLLALLGIAMGAIIVRQKRALLGMGNMAPEKLAFIAALVCSALLTLYFRRQVVMLPGFVVLGLVGAWTLRKVREAEEKKEA